MRRIATSKIKITHKSRQKSPSILIFTSRSATLPPDRPNHPPIERLETTSNQLKKASSAMTNASKESVQTNTETETNAPEFVKLAQENQAQFTQAAAEKFGVTIEQFTNWRWQMKHQIRTLDEASKYLHLTQSEIDGFRGLGDLFIAGITPYYASLCRNDHSQNTAEQCPIRLQAIPRSAEFSDSLGIKDPLLEEAHSPVKEVVHVYPDRVAFCVAQLCPVYCRYCFRKRRDDEVGLHFNRSIVKRGIDYIASNPAIKDVLITGGDPFIASDQAIDSLLSKIRAIPHVEIIRFGTRTPVTLPYRVTAKLAKIISKYHPVWLNTHFNCAEEITEEAKLAIKNLVDHGIPVGNQAVLLRGINDSSERLIKLCRALLKERIRPYYLFHPHRIEGTEHLRVSVKRGMKIMKSLRGRITGFGIPTYALDTPSGKIPLNHNYAIKEDGDDLLIESLHGEIWREKGALLES